MPRKKRVEPRRLRVRLYPYQQRWVEDESRFKLALKARQIGFSFAAAFRVVRRRLAQPGLTIWLSASERQALEAMEHIRHHLGALGAVVAYAEDTLPGTEIRQHHARLENGSRIVALPANPDTVRGFAGDVVLDEFAFHRDPDAIWRAAFATATRGFQIEIISTPNGARGRFYDLCRAAGLVEPQMNADERRWSSASGAAPVPSHQLPVTDSIWSAHWCDIHQARAQGFGVEVESLRAAIDDEDAWQQEYCCRFLSPAAQFLPPELVVAAEHPDATAGFPFASGVIPSAARDRLPASTASPASDSSRRPSASARNDTALTSHCFLGVDIGRRRDLTVLWVVECENPHLASEARVYCTRGVVELERQPFAAQRAVLNDLLALRRDPAENRKTKSENREAEPVFEFRVSSFVIARAALDATGLGAMLAEELQQKWGARVEPVSFTLAVKADLAVRVKRLLEDGRLKIPCDPRIRAALGAIKRSVTAAGHWRFDAERTEAAGHADHFWALALALLAAEDSPLSTEYSSTGVQRAFAQAYAF